MRPLGHHLRQKALKGGVPPTAGAQNAQGYVFIDSGIGFGVILG